MHLASGGGSLDPQTINRLPAAVRDAAFAGISHAADGVFFWTVPAALAVLMLAVLIHEIPLRGRAGPPGENAPAPEPEFVG